MNPEINSNDNIKWYNKGFWKVLFTVLNVILSIIIINEILLHFINRDKEK